MRDLSTFGSDFRSFLDCSKSTPYPTDSLFLYHSHYFFVNGQTPFYYQHIRHDCRTDNERVKMRFKAISIVICSRYMIQSLISLFSAGYCSIIVFDYSFLTDSSWTFQSWYCRIRTHLMFGYTCRNCIVQKIHRLLNHRLQACINSQPIDIIFHLFVKRSLSRVYSVL